MLGMKNINGYVLGAVMGLSCLAALTPAATAGTVLNLSDGHGSGPFATVTLTQVDSNTVGVDVAMFPNYKFVDTGSHDTFGFNLNLQAGATGVSLTNFSSGFVADNGFSNGFAGTYAYSVAFSACAPGGSGPQAGPLDFNVNVATGSLSVADFVNKFAADVIGPDGNGATFTGLVTNGGTPPSVPEPLSLSLVGGGLLALGLLRKRLPRQ